MMDLDLIANLFTRDNLSPYGIDADSILTWFLPMAQDHCNVINRNAMQSELLDCDASVGGNCGMSNADDDVNCTDIYVSLGLIFVRIFIIISTYVRVLANGHGRLSLRDLCRDDLGRPAEPPRAGVSSPPSRPSDGALGRRGSVSYRGYGDC